MTKELQEKDCKQLCDALWSGENHTRLDTAATRNSLDNRVSVRLYLLLRGVKDQSYQLLVEAYDNGFYMRCDGKSTPFGVFKLSYVQKRLRFKKDIVSVRHDLDYYRGFDQKEADLRYKELQLAVGYNKYKTEFEYQMLKLFGRFAWRAHEKKRQQNPEYGTDGYIKQLPIFRLVDQKSLFSNVD